MNSTTDHADDEVGTLAEFLTAHGWQLVRIDKEQGRDVGIFSKGGRVMRAGDAVKREWETWSEKQEATK